MFEPGHEKLEGAGRPPGAKSQCTEIRRQRRANAIIYAVEQQKRLKDIEEKINADNDLRAGERYRLLLEIERIRQNEITLSIPAEQSVKIDDENKIKSARRWLERKAEIFDNKQTTPS